MQRCSLSCSLRSRWNYALHEVLRAGRLLLLVALLVGGTAQAQNELSTPESTPAPDGETTLSVAEPDPTPTSATPTGIAPAPREFGRTIVLVLGGVSWSDWLALASQSSTATPGFRRVLEEGALGAAFLPGQEKAQQNDNRVSDAMLRAALLLSTGDPQALRNLPQEAAFTLGLRESWARTTPGYEEGEAAVAFARRMNRAPQPGNLVNLGWGSLLQNATPDTRVRRGEESRSSPLGALAEAVHRAGGRTAALGSGDTTVDLQESTPLREWALLGSDAGGIVDAGDVSARLMARDNTAPFGLRANRKAVLQTLDGLLKSGQTTLIAMEWGDTRRAQEYSQFCAPEVAASHRQAALRNADAFLQALVGGVSTPVARLNAPRDRLLLVIVPDLHSPSPQWLPVAYWRPSRGGQGAMLEKIRGGESVGAILLENLHARLVAPLGVVDASTLPPSLTESGGPQSATRRISKLIAMQSGLSWLQNARHFSHALWCAIFILACAWTLWALRHPLSTRAASGARLCWIAAMIFPWLLWLAGLCVETTWRFGVAEAGWRLFLALFFVACLMLFLVGATFNWFGHARLQRIRIGVIWFLLSFIGLLVGGFVLPWNALLHLSPADVSTPAVRSGEVWSLLFISATLLAISALTKSRVEVLPSRTERRVLNLRPAAIWAVAAIVLLWLSRFGHDATGATIALIACGTMWLRMWLERAPRETRLRHRRIVFVAVAIGVLLLWQRGQSVSWSETFIVWREGWGNAWQSAWWVGALLALLILVFAFAFTNARELLRNYLAPRYSLRAMLGATAIASVSGLIIYGPAAPPLLATFTLGALAHEVLGSLEENLV